MPYSKVLAEAYANMDPARAYMLPNNMSPKNLSLAWVDHWMPSCLQVITTTTLWLIILLAEKKTLDSPHSSSFSLLQVMIPTMSELVRRNRTTWQRIADKQLLVDVTFSEFISTANGLQIPGYANLSFQFDKNADLLVPNSILNINNQSLQALLRKNSTTHNDLFTISGIWYNNSVRVWTDLQFTGGSTTPPRVTFLTLPRESSSGLFRAVFIMTLILEAFFVASLIAIIINRDKPAIRKNSFSFLCIIIIGCIVELASTFPGYVSRAYDNKLTCQSVSYLSHLGFALAFGGILLKVWRIYRIFTNTRAGGVNLQDSTLLRYQAAIFTTFLGLLLAQTFGVSMVVVKGEEAVDDLTSLVWTVCRIDSLEFVMLALEFLILIFGAVLAFKTRRIQEEYKESQSLGICVYNCLFLLIIALIVDSVLLSTPTPESKHMIHFVRVALTTGTIVTLLCIPKLIWPYTGGQGWSTKYSNDINRNPRSTMATTNTGQGSSTERSEKIKEDYEKKLRELETRKDEVISDLKREIVALKDQIEEMKAGSSRL
ncbi:hypothetical protein HK102_012774 [Quaeritorhiza haematococci]|nr:hypothetical protein HK102_012774 [Quaeritorhiza haematococci]